MCNCIQMSNKALEEFNTKLVVAMYIVGNKPSRAMVSTEKKDSGKRGKAISLTAAFCPFCGADYDEEEKILKDKNETQP